MIQKFLTFDAKPDLISILWGWLFSAMGFGVLLPYVSLYFTSRFDMAIGDVGYFFLITSLFRAGFQAYAGNLSDSIGRKSVIILSLLGRALFLILLSILELYKIHTFLSLFLVGLIYIFSAIFQPVVQAAIADCVPDEKFLEGFSVVRIAGNIGWIIAPVIGGYLYDISISYFFFTSGAFSILGAYIFYFHFKNEHQIIRKKQKISYNYIFMNKIFVLFCLISFFMMLTSSQLLSTLPYFLKNQKNFPSYLMGFIFSINGLTVILTQYPILKYFQKINSFIGMSIGAFLYGIGYLFVGIADSLWHFSFLIFLISIAETIVLPLAQSSVASLSSKSIYGRYMGFFGIVTVTGWSIGPMLGTQILEYVRNIMVSWFILSVFALLSGIGYAILYIMTGVQLKKKKSY